MRVWTFSTRSGFVPFDQWKPPPRGGTDEDARQANGFLPETAVVLGALRDETAPGASIYLRDPDRRSQHIADYLVEVVLGESVEVVLCDRFPDLLVFLNQLAPILQAGLHTSSYWSAASLEAELSTEDADDAADTNGVG